MVTRKEKERGVAKTDQRVNCMVKNRTECLVVIIMLYIKLFIYNSTSETYTAIMQCCFNQKN